MEKFGVYAVNLRVKVTNEPRKAGKLIVIPGQMGFKQRGGEWVNEWVDIILFEALQGDVPAKGETCLVSGRMELSEWKEKKQWKVYADSLAAKPKQVDSDPGPLPEIDVPF